MHTIKVKRDELLGTLRRNREGHRTLFLKAQEGYRAAVIAELDAMLSEARSGKRIRRAVALAEPIDQTREYDRAIKMMEMSVDDVIELDSNQFDNYVMDNWAWQANVTATNSLYAR